MCSFSRRVRKPTGKETGIVRHSCCAVICCAIMLRSPFPDSKLHGLRRMDVLSSVFEMVCRKLCARDLCCVGLTCRKLHSSVAAEHRAICEDFARGDEPVPVRVIWYLPFRCMDILCSAPFLPFAQSSAVQGTWLSSSLFLQSRHQL